MNKGRQVNNQTKWSIDQFMKDLMDNGVEFVLYKKVVGNSIIFEIKVRNSDKEVDITADLITHHFVQP